MIKTGCTLSIKSPSFVNDGVLIGYRLSFPPRFPREGVEKSPIPRDRIASGVLN